MKKILKKLSCALLAAAMVCAMTPLAASAAINYSKTRIVYMPTSGKDLGYDEISISNIPAKQNILKSNVKVVSGGSVIALDSFGSSSFKSTTEAFRKGAKPYTHSDHFYNIGFAVKKPGTGKISFKVGNKTYTSTIKVLRYVNPLKSVSITGVKGNLAGKFKSSGHNAFRYANKAQKNAVMKCTAANGWKITEGVLEEECSEMLSTFFRELREKKKQAKILKKQEAERLAGQTQSESAEQKEKSREIYS